MKVTLAIVKSLFLFLGLSAIAAASGLRGAAPTDEEQSRRMLPPGQPNYGMTPSEHMAAYGVREFPIVFCSSICLEQLHCFYCSSAVLSVENV